MEIKDKEQKHISPARRFFNLIQLERKDIGLVYSYAIINGVVGLSLPLAIQAIMSLLISQQITTSWAILIAVVIIGILFSGIIQIMQFSVLETIQQRIFVRTAFDFSYRVPLMKLEDLLKKYSPELMNRFFDVPTVQKGIVKIFTGFATSVIQIVFSLILLAFYHPFFAFFGVLLAGLLIVFFYFSAPKGLDTSIKESKYKYQVAGWLEELARSMGIFKLAGETEMPLKTTDRFVNKYLTARQSHFRVLVTQWGVIVGFKILVTAGLLIIGSVLVFSKEISIGQFVASDLVIIIILNSVEKLNSSLETIYDVLTGLDKIGHVTDIEIEEGDGIPFDKIDNGKGFEIELNKVSYSFYKDGHKALKDIDLHILPGEKVCFAGNNGSGKTTLINIVASLLHNYEGVVKINGFNLRSINSIELRAHVGENLSTKEILGGSILENISMGREDISLDDVIKASKSTGLLEFVQSLPKGFETDIVQNDITLPRSVLTKISIARSIAEKPELFLLDEFLLSLDKVERISIVDHLTNPDTHWTLLGSSNDTYFASRCDKIVVLDDGAIKDVLTYEELQQKDYYPEIFRM